MNYLEGIIIGTDWDYDFRIQKIGNHYRAFRRFSTNWKGKGMNQHDEGNGRSIGD
jgi:hypothetical protein